MDPWEVDRREGSVQSGRQATGAFQASLVAVAALSQVHRVDASALFQLMPPRLRLHLEPLSLLPSEQFYRTSTDAMTKWCLLTEN